MNTTSRERLDLLETFVEIEQPTDDQFRIIMETLSRIGVANERLKTLTQTAHILKKRNRYFILHFKELFDLDGKPSTITNHDKARKNSIVRLLEQWGLVKIKNPQIITDISFQGIKVVPHKEKKDWVFSVKYKIGTKKSF